MTNAGAERPSRVVRWLDAHPTFARLYVPLAVTANLFVTLITELPSPRR